MLEKDLTGENWERFTLRKHWLEQSELNIFSSPGSCTLAKSELEKDQTGETWGKGSNWGSSDLNTFFSSQLVVESILSWTWVFGIFFLQNILEICRKSSSKPGDLLKELEQGSDWVYLRLKGSSWRSSILMPLVDLSNFLTWFPFPCSCHKHPFHFQVPHVQYSNSKCPIFQQFL